jgi:predicted DNA binding protein
MDRRTTAKAGKKKSTINAGAQSGHLAVCKLCVSLPLPYWHPEMAKRHPETRIDVLGYSLVDDGMLVDMRVHVNDITTWIDELREFEDVHDVTPLGKVGKAVTVRATYKRNHFFEVVNRLHLILRTPVSIKDGSFDVMMAGPEANVQRFIKMFPSQVQVKAVYDTESDKNSLLTPRQLSIFRRAMAEGYFEVPRRVTLTELASRIGVAASSLSEMLAVVEKKLLQESPAAKIQ